MTRSNVQIGYHIPVIRYLVPGIPQGTIGTIRNRFAFWTTSAYDGMVEGIIRHHGEGLRVTVYDKNTSNSDPSPTDQPTNVQG